jgi:hypothetical protein
MFAVTVANDRKKLTPLCALVPADHNLQPMLGYMRYNGKWYEILEESKEYVVDRLLDGDDIRDLGIQYNVDITTIKAWYERITGQRFFNFH